MRAVSLCNPNSCACPSGWHSLFVSLLPTWPFFGAPWIVPGEHAHLAVPLLYCEESRVAPGACCPHPLCALTLHCCFETAGFCGSHAEGMKVDMDASVMDTELQENDEDPEDVYMEECAHALHSAYLLGHVCEMLSSLRCVMLVCISIGFRAMGLAPCPT
eukprot:1150230-Pelagomonas_calceolata.AAC.2